MRISRSNIIPNRQKIEVIFGAILIIIGLAHPLFAQNEIHRISVGDMSVEDKSIYLSDRWLFQSGDDPAWADPALADSSWQEVSTYLGPSDLPFIDWNGIGWFRLHLKVDSSLVNYALALLVQQHNGASQIYLDDKKIAQIGTVAASKSRYKPEREFSPIPIVFPDTTEHVLAVRYANYDAQYFNQYNALGFTAGFRFLLGDLNYYTSDQPGKDDPGDTKLPIFFIGSLLAFTVIHTLLYAFYPAGKRNLYFALFTGSLVLLIYSLYTFDSNGSPIKALFYYRFSLLCWIFTMVVALRFTYSLLRPKTPIPFWFFLAAGGAICFFSWYTTQEPVVFRELFVLLTLLEIIRVLIVSLFRKRKGLGIVAAGVLFFVGSIFYKMLIDLDIIAGHAVVSSIYGSAAMIFSMSIYLSRDFAKTNRQLEQKLREVKHLSERSLAQERLNRKKEVERRLLKAENERKSKELDKARQLQFSMLPKKIPGTDFWDIAVFMDTAQEVGGDYYDFSESESEGLTVAIGDATGHGMSAGIMVAAVKSYFHTLADGDDLVETLAQISSGIRNMNLKLMFMGLQLLKCSKNEVSIASAGMPPALWFKKDSQCVEDLRIKGLPLGTKAQYPYEARKISVNPGDVLLLMSDGLTELFNRERQQLGQERIKQTLLEVANHSASDILSRLSFLIEDWAGEEGQEDDITIMVMKAKE